MHVIGEVRGRDAILLDDIIDTEGTVFQAVFALKAEGARRIITRMIPWSPPGPSCW